MRVLLEGSFIDYQYQLAKALGEHEETILVLPLDQLPEDLAEMAHCRFSLRLCTSNGLGIFPRKLRIFAKLVSIVRRIDPDIVHLQVGGGVDNLLVFLYFKIVKRRPIVATFHDVKAHLGNRPILMLFNRYWIRKYSDALIVHGNRLRQQMIDEYKTPADRVHATSIGQPETSRFRKYERIGATDDGKTVLFFGRIEKYKGLEYLIKAEPIIAKAVPGVKIVIAGMGRGFSQYEDMISQRRQSFVVYNYRISFREGAEIFQRSSVVVLPYVEGSQTGVVPTAYGFKKPVVVTDVGSIPEIVDDGVTGLVVPPRNAERLAEAIVRILQDNSLRSSMGENAFAKLKSDLSVEQVAEQNVHVYEHAVLAKRNRQSR